MTTVVIRSDRIYPDSTYTDVDQPQKLPRHQRRDERGTQLRDAPSSISLIRGYLICYWRSSNKHLISGKTVQDGLMRVA